MELSPVSFKILSMKMRNFLFIFLIPFLVSGCVTTGPYVSPGEVYQVTEELKVKALKFKLQKEQKVAEVGYRLLKSIDEKLGSFPYLGARFIRVDDYVRRLFNISSTYPYAIAYCIKDSPAEKAGLKAGDVVKEINGIRIYSSSALRSVLRNIQPQDKVELVVIRGTDELKFHVVCEEVPANVRFRMVDEEMINAGATPNEVVVTYGLMRFINSDDELAIILGHELAHIIRGHIAKRIGTDLLAVLLGIAAGYGAESISPGSGDVVMQGVGSAFSSYYSREFEREADYYGILYAYRAGYDIHAGIDVWERFAVEVPQSLTRDFFSTHPTSAERLLRIKKIVQELEAEGKIPSR